MAVLNNSWCHGHVKLISTDNLGAPKLASRFEQAGNGVQRNLWRWLNYSWGRRYWWGLWQQGAQAKATSRVPGSSASRAKSGNISFRKKEVWVGIEDVQTSRMVEKGIAWTRWESTLQWKITCPNICQADFHCLGFLVQAVYYNVLSSPANFHIQSKYETPSCSPCSGRGCSLEHILSICPTSFGYRHYHFCQGHQHHQGLPPVKDHNAP